ncbi:hypothetical protein [Pseudomonas sp. NA-150]|uniref:hypothetical protein n=1 Tax=Pseudomonas sp. NA-150 TaxID=3367525 RepID=UPI0037C89A2C
MRFNRLLTLAASLALLLPLGAQAESVAWPGAGRAQFVNDCVNAASNPSNSNKLTRPEAQSHCTCGADTVEKTLTSAELKVIDADSDAGRAARAKLLPAIDRACPRK